MNKEFKEGDKVYWLYGPEEEKKFLTVSCVEEDRVWFTSGTWLPKNRVFHANEFSVGDLVHVTPKIFNQPIFKVIGIDGNDVWVKSIDDGSRTDFLSSVLEHHVQYEPKVGDVIKNVTIIAIYNDMVWVKDKSSSYYTWNKDDVINYYNMYMKPA